MALKPCRECGREVSTDAKQCPHCGKKNPVQATSSVAMGCLAIVAVVLVIGVISIISSNPQPNAPTVTPAQVEQAKQQERERHANADSLLQGTSPQAVRSLADFQLALILDSADSTLNGKAFAAVRNEVDRRRAQAAHERQRQRLDQFRQAAANYRFSDGSGCPRGGSARVESIMRSHPDWAEHDVAGVACRAIWIGMTSDQLRASRGAPQTINRTVLSSGTNEQWVYGDEGPYVYVENGVVTAWQD